MSKPRYYHKTLIPQGINRIEWIEQIVQLAKVRKAIWCVHLRRIMPAAALMNQQASVLQRWIENRYLYVYNKSDNNEWIE